MNAASLKHATIHGRAYKRMERIYPDLSWVIDLDFTKVTDRGAVLVRPDICGLSKDKSIQFAVEISMSTARHDLSLKKDTYAEFGVPHYVVFDCTKDRVLEFRLIDGIYRPEEIGLVQLNIDEEFFLV